MKLFKSFFAIFLTAIIFVTVSRLEPEMFQNNSNDSLFTHLVFLDKMKAEGTMEFQIQNSLDAFKSSFFNLQEKYMNMSVEPEKLKSLPNHEIFLCVASNGKLLSFNSFSNVSRELAKLFVKADYKYEKRFNQKNAYEDFKKLQPAFSKLMGRFLGLTKFGSDYIFDKGAKLTFYRTDKQNIAIYWDKFTMKNGDQGYIFVKFNFSKQNLLYPFWSFSKVNMDSEIPFAYYAIGSNKIACNKKMKKLLNANFISWIKKESTIDKQKKILRRYKNLTVIFGLTSVWSNVRPIVIYSAHKTKNIKINTLPNLLILIIFTILTFLTTEIFIFQRGPRISIKTILICSFAIAMGIPLMIAKSIYSNVLKEKSITSRLTLERTLHKTLSGIDNGIQIFHSNINQMIRNTCNKPKFVKKLVEEEKNNFPPDKNGKGSVLEEISKSCLAPIAIKGDKNKKFNILNTIVVEGPKKFLRMYNRQSDITYTSATIPKMDSAYNSADVTIDALRDSVDEKILDPDFKQKENASSKISMNELRHEQAKTSMIGAVGPERMFNFITNVNSVNSFGSNVGKGHIDSFWIKYNNLIRYFAVSGWGEISVLTPYLKIIFSNNKIKDINNRHIELQGYSNLRQDTISIATNPSQLLTSIIKDCRMRRQIKRVETFGKNSAIYESIPGNKFSLYYIGGKASTGYLKTEEANQNKKYNIILIFFICFSILAAYAISQSFTKPIYYLLSGMEQIKQNKFSTRLKVERQDEFGMLNSSFNNMAKSLEEKDTLGHYVSESVLRISQNNEDFEKAKRGSISEYTILFATLTGFEEFRNSSTRDKIENKMRKCLEILFSQTLNFNGEVDKIMGDKILITFSHAKLGAKTAVESAIQLAESAIIQFETIKNIRPAFGINSGTVISGIIGTPTVRMDYTVIGDPVNVASRLCSLAEKNKHDIIISGVAKQHLVDTKNFVKLNISKVRGKKQEVEAYTIKENS